MRRNLLAFVRGRRDDVATELTARPARGRSGAGGHGGALGGAQDGATAAVDVDRGERDYDEASDSERGLISERSEPPPAHERLDVGSAGRGTARKSFGL